MTRSNNKKLTDYSYYNARELGEEWNEKLLRIARESPVESGGFRILFDRSPDIFTIPKLTSHSYRCGGLFMEEELLGYAIATFQKRYIDRERLSDVMYLGNMHVTKKRRGTGFFYRMSEFFFGDLSPRIEYFYAYIMEQNEPALSMVNRRHARFPNTPYSTVVGVITMVTILLNIPVRMSKKYTIRTATHDDIEPIVELLQEEFSARFLAPEINRDIFLKNLQQRPNFGIENYLLALTNNQIVGVCSGWDMTSFKKNRVMGYGITLGMTRLLFNAVAPLWGIRSLPDAGEPFRDITIAEYAVKDREPAIMEALLRYAYNTFKRQGYHSIIFGTSVDDPLLALTKSFITKQVRSHVVLSSMEAGKLTERKNIPLIYADTVQI